MAPSLKDTAKQDLESNRSALGDPVSLKAEKSDTEPTEQDRGAGQQDGKSLKDLAQEKLHDNKNATMLGDPVSMKAETSSTEVTEHDRGAAGPQGDLRKESPKKDSKL